MRHGMTLLAPAFVLLLGGFPVEVVAHRAGAGAIPAQAPPQRQATIPPLPDERLGVRTAPLLLLSRVDVRSDLALDDQQTADAMRAIADLHARAAALRGRPNSEVIEARKVVDEAQQAWIAANLTIAQRDRLVQIDLQWEGPSAVVSRPVVADTLALSAEQRAAIKKAIAEKRDEKTLTLAVLALLSPVQRERWKAMLGRAFKPQFASRAAGPTR
jgi:hypothetical protein